MTNRNAIIVKDAEALIEKLNLHIYHPKQKEFTTKDNKTISLTGLNQSIIWHFSLTPLKQHHTYVRDLAKQIAFILEF